MMVISLFPEILSRSFEKKFVIQTVQKKAQKKTRAKIYCTLKKFDRVAILRHLRAEGVVYFAWYFE
jgi:hypothetical protein